MKILLLDNYDSFTWMLRDYLEQAGGICDVIRNDEEGISLLDESCYDAVVISPGPCSPAESGRAMEVVAHYHSRRPILGVCLGHQAIGVYFGAQLHKAAQPMHGKVQVMQHTGDVLFDGIPPAFEATRYHSLVLDKLPRVLNQTASAANGEVMALRHESLPVYGIQFHPESCMTVHGYRIIENFVRLAKQFC